MSLSPLAVRIYRTLVRQARSPNPLISYGDLVRALGPLSPPYADLKANDPRLFEALEEIIHTCRGQRPPLPVLTSIVVRREVDGSLGSPGTGYFALVFPHVRDEATRLRMWQQEVERVSTCTYPTALGPPEAVPTPGPPPLPAIEPRSLPRWLHEPTVIAAIIGLVGTFLTVVASVWVATRHTEPKPQPLSERPAVTVVLKSDNSSPKPARPEPKAEPQKVTLDHILEVLERHKQRATFGAVAALLDRDPRSLFSGYTRTPRTAWIVSKSTGLPTGTKEADYPPGLLQNKQIIETADELQVWLRGHR